MRPAGIAAIVSEALRRRPQLVVECGSGNSTIFLARALRQLGDGHVITLDHDEAWGRVTREIVAREGLDEHATVVDAAERLSSLPRLGRKVRALAAAAMSATDPSLALFTNLHPLF